MNDDNDMGQTAELDGNKKVLLTSGTADIHTIKQLGEEQRHIFLSSGELRLQNIVLEGTVFEEPFRGGGGIIVNWGSLVVSEGASIQNCGTSGRGGAIEVHEGAVLMTAGTISGNRAVSRENPDVADVSGGGIFLDRSRLTLEGGTIRGNSSHNKGGGGIGAANGSAVSIPEDSSILVSENYTTYNDNNGGGGILIGSDSELNMAGGTISKNYTAREDEAAGGGGLSILGSATISGGTIVENETNGGMPEELWSPILANLR